VLDLWKTHGHKAARYVSQCVTKTQTNTPTIRRQSSSKNRQNITDRWLRTKSTHQYIWTTLIASSHRYVASNIRTLAARLVKLAGQETGRKWSLMRTCVQFSQRHMTKQIWNGLAVVGTTDCLGQDHWDINTLKTTEQTRHHVRDYPPPPTNTHSTSLGQIYNILDAALFRFAYKTWSDAFMTVYDVTVAPYKICSDLLSTVILSRTWGPRKRTCKLVLEDKDFPRGQQHWLTYWQTSVSNIWHQKVRHSSVNLRTCRMPSPWQFFRTLWSKNKNKCKDLRSEDKDLRSEDKDLMSEDKDL